MLASLDGLSNMLVQLANFSALLDKVNTIGGNPAQPDDGWSYMAPLTRTTSLRSTRGRLASCETSKTVEGLQWMNSTPSMPTAVNRSLTS